MSIPGIKKGGSVIALPLVSAQKTTVASKASLAFRQVLFTSKDLETPDSLYKALHAFQQNTWNAMRPVLQNPTIAGNIVQNVMFTAGQSVLVAHLLGREYVGWYCVRAQTAAWSGFELPVSALPPGTTAAQFINLKSTNAGTYDFFIF